MTEENDLEAQRLANIAANAQRMQEFGLHEAAQSVKPKAKAVQPPRPRPARGSMVLQPLRKSARAANIPAPVYCETVLFDAQERESKRQRRTKRRSSGEGLKHSWAHVQPHYTQAAMDKALDKAMAFGEALSNPWNLKVMSHSTVSPGFWCQAPKALVPHVGAKTKDVWFETTDRLCGTDATHFRDAEAGSSPAQWRIVWLERENGGAGFSGNWAGFSNDQMRLRCRSFTGILLLKCGDVVLWEVLGPNRFNVHLFRAGLHETDAALRATLPGGARCGPFYSASKPEELEAHPSSDAGSPRSSDSMPAAEEPQQQQHSGGGSSPGSAARPSSDAAEAPAPKRARIDGSGKAPSPKRPAAALSPQAAWPTNLRQAQVTEFMPQRKLLGGAASTPQQQRHGQKQGLKRRKDPKLTGAAMPQQKAEQKLKAKVKRSSGKRKQPAAQGPRGPPPKEIDANGEEVYYVKGLVDRIVDVDGELWWKIRWRGYSAADDTWETSGALDKPASEYKWLGAAADKPVVASS